MKIGDLFISLGFQVEGGPQLEKADFSVKQLATKAAAAAVAVNALNAAFIAMVSSAAKAAVEMRNFGLQTGFSTEQLQRFQYAAAGTGTTGEEIADAVRGIAKAQADIKMGEGNIAPWQLLGIDPRQDPFKVLEQMRERIKGLEPNLARTILAQAGVSDKIFTLLRDSNVEFDKLQQKFLLTQNEQDNMAKMNKEWAEFVRLLASVRNRFAATFAEPLQAIAKVLKVVINIFATFVDWLSKGSAAANVVKWVLWAIVAVLGVLGAALAAIAVTLGVAAAAMAALDVAAAPILPILLAISAGIVAMVAVLAIAVLWFEDLWVAIKGGKSVYGEIGEWQRKFFGEMWDNLVKTGQFFKDVWNGIVETVRGAVGAMTSLLPKWMVNGGFGPFSPGFMQQEAATPNMNGAAGGASMRQENNFEVNISGNDNPLETGRAVADNVQKQLSDASYQQSVTNY